MKQYDGLHDDQTDDQDSLATTSRNTKPALSGARESREHPHAQKSVSGNKLTKTSKSKYRSFERTLKPSASVNCLNKTMPTTVPVRGAGSTTKHAQSTANLVSNPHEHHEHSRERSSSPHDASNLAFPMNPFDHLMPHKDDYGTRTD